MINAVLKWFGDNVGFITMFVGIVTVFAIFHAPIVALRIQKNIEEFNEKQSRKLNIFKTLLATRQNIISPEHVQSLNMVDIEFYEQKIIRDAWNIYRDHLNSYPQNLDKSAEDRWEEKRIEYMTDLLYEMSMFFGYDFDKVILKKGAYSPLAHGILNLELAFIRKGFVDLLSGQKPIKVELTEQQKLVEDAPQTENTVNLDKKS